MPNKLKRQGYSTTDSAQGKRTTIVPVNSAGQTERSEETKPTGTHTFQNARQPNPKKKASLAEIANNSISAGLSQFNKSLTNTLDFLLPTEFLGDYDFVSKVADYYSEQDDKHREKLEDSVSDRGKFVQVGSETFANTVAAAPNAALAVITGGGSAAAQGTTASLTAAASAAQSSGLLSTAANTVNSIVKNPMYWSSVGQTLGNNYDKAKANGATEPQAIGSAFTSSLLNGAIEAGGGMDTLPGVLKSGTGPATAWAKSALTEGLEEPVQSTVSGLSEKLFYDRDKPLFSPTDTTAVIHPGRMGQEFTTGAAVGGILGAGQLAGSKLYTNDPDVLAQQGDYSGYVRKLQEMVDRKKVDELLTEYKKHIGKASDGARTEDRLDALTVSNYDKQKEVDLYGETGVGGTGQADRKGQSRNIDTRRGETLRRSVQEVYEGKTVHGRTGRITQENVHSHEPIRMWAVGNIIEPVRGSVAHTEQQLSKEYNIPCFVVADKVWEQNKGDVPAFAAGGQIYLKETLPEEQRGMFVAHEATHVMRQVNYQPYIDFVWKTPDLLNIRTRAAQRLIEGCAEHNGINPMNMTKAERDALYDEINATVFGSLATNDEIALSYVRPAFQDFDVYLSELTELHQQFKKHRFQEMLDEKIDTYWEEP